MALPTESGCERIRSAFLTLIASKPIESITVKDICSKADISRSLFYTHYEGKYELLEDIESQLIDGFLLLMLEIRNSGKDRFYESMRRHDSSYFKKYFEYVRIHSEAFSALLCSRYPNGFSMRFTRAIMKTRMETRKIWGHNDFTENKALILREELLSALYVSLFSSWLNGNAEIPEETLSMLLIDLWYPLSNFEYEFQHRE